MAEPVPVAGLFETHLTVADLPRSVAFYRDVVGLSLAFEVPERGAALFWIAAPGEGLLGLWSIGSAPMGLLLHLAFKASLEDVMGACDRLRSLGVTPLSFFAEETTEPSVIGWMPAAAVYLARSGRPSPGVPRDAGRAAAAGRRNRSVVAVDRLGALPQCVGCHGVLRLVGTVLCRAIDGVGGLPWSFAPRVVCGDRLILCHPPRERKLVTEPQSIGLLRQREYVDRRRLAVRMSLVDLHYCQPG